MSRIPCVSTRSGDDTVLARWVAGLGRPESSEWPWLGQGSALSALLVSTYARINEDSTAFELAAEHLRFGATLLGKFQLTSAFHQGLSGYGWCLQVFPCPEMTPWRNELLRDIDDLLVRGLSQRILPNIDIVNGIAGIVLYGLDRGRSQSSSEALWRSLDLRIYELLSLWNRSDISDLLKSKSLSNLGIAHGIPGVMSVCAEAINRGLVTKCSTKMLEESLDKLWEMRLVSEKGLVQFPYTIGGSGPARLAWCYGNLGLAALYANGSRISSKFVRHTNELTESSLSQYFDSSCGINDASLCHGEAGVLAAFGYLERSGIIEASLNQQLSQGISMSLNSAKSLERKHGGRSTFLYQLPDKMVPSVSYLEGGAGVALAISAYEDRLSRGSMSPLSYFEAA